MGFIKAGFTGGFIGIVVGIAALFTKSALVQKLATVGFLLAQSFGKVCIDTEAQTCTLPEKFTTILATIVGNCIAYFIIGALISLGVSVIMLWIRAKPKEPEQAKEPTAQPAVVVIEERPKSKAKILKVKAK